MKTRYKIAFAAMVGASLVSCNDFLDESPSKSENIEITTVAQLEALLDDNAFNSGQIDNNAAQMYCSDCFEMTPELYDGFSQSGDITETCQMAVWDMPKLAVTNENLCEWGGEYGKIYLANLVLANIDDVEGDEAKLAEVRARACALRAYSYLELVNYYCMPYGPKTLQSLGLPLKTKPNYEENLQRTTLEQTYAFMEGDVLEAVKLKTPVMNGSKRESWRETGAFANSVAARFYLNKGDYVQAQKYAEAALALAPDLLDLTSGEVYLKTDMFTGLQQPNTYAPDEFYTCYVPDTDRAYYHRSYYYFFAIWAVPSDYLLGLLDKDYDLRYKFFIIPQFQKIYAFGMFEGYFEHDVPGYCTYNMRWSNAPNSAEMMLVKAECQAREGQVSQAMTTLNGFRATRFDAGAPSTVVNLSTSDKNTAVRYVLEERAREFPFTQRWSDIRRCNFNDDTSDDITVTREFYTVGQYNIDKTLKTYTLAPSTPSNYAVAIPNAEIVAGAGVIEQNPY